MAGLDRRASVLVLSNPGNPTGKVHCATRLQSVVDVTERHGIALVVDESFSETVHDRDAWLETPNIKHTEKNQGDKSRHEDKLIPLEQVLAPSEEGA